MHIKTELKAIGGYEGIPQPTETLERTFRNWDNSSWNIGRDIKKEMVQNHLVAEYNGILTSGYYIIRYQYGNQVEYYFMHYLKGCNLAESSRYLGNLKKMVSEFDEEALKKWLDKEREEIKSREDR